MPDMLGSGLRIHVALCMVVCAVSTTAAAQTDEELVQLRATFGEGVQATQDERWDEAVAAFRTVIAVRDTVAVRYNLAFALSHTDAIGEAARLLDSVLADPEVDDRTREQATAVLATLETRMGRVTIRLLGDEAGMTVLLDGEEVSLGQIGQPIRVAPGAHQIVLRHGSEDIATRSVSVDEGGAEDVLLSTNSTTSDDEPSGGDGSGGGGDITSQWWFWTAIGAGVVAVGAGIIIGVSVSSDGTVQPVAGNLDPGVLRLMP